MATSILGGINQETTQQELLAEAIILLKEISLKMPRTDTQARILTNASEISSSIGVISMGQTNVRYPDHIPPATMTAGMMHLYNNLVFS